ncbi:MAG: DUF177 domain-containing protein [Candidatus Nanopelagicus sp.]|jgi:uncharacterized protein|nr:DUF177 domain-containing protein [Candidatus Nanopelagicus sp.]
MARSIFIFNTHDLPHRAGEIREYELDLEITEPVGVDLLSVKPGEIIELDLRIQSVDEGVLTMGRVMAQASGECTRCLDGITWPIDESFTELFYYETAASKSAGKKRGKERSAKDNEVDLEEADLYYMDGDEIDLELPVRDAVILNLEVNPLCSEDCPGLCQVCGEKWRALPKEHSHTEADPRWAALKDFDA